MKEFALNGQAYIELNKLLKHLRLVGSGGEANQCIVERMVTVNDAIETQKRKKLRAGDKVTFNDITILISEV